MNLRFAHLADYAAVGSDGKLTVVGGFDLVWDNAGVRPIQFPPFYLVAGIEASIGEGPEHKMQISLVNDDEEEQHLKLELVLHFRANGAGHPARANALLGFGPGAVSVSEHGDYHFRFVVDGKPLGALRVSVLQPAKRA